MSRAVVKRRRATPRQVLGVAFLGAVLAFVDATNVNARSVLCALAPSV